MRRALVLTASALALFACSTEPDGTKLRQMAGGDGTNDGNSSGSDGNASDGDGKDGDGNGADGTSGSPKDAGPTSGNDAGTGSAGDVLRFVVLGDGGTGDAAQKKVAAVVKKVCAARGCELALYVGDNIYESGVSSADDAQFQSKFEEPYADLDFPFFVVLGNHDHSGLTAGAGFSAQKAHYEVEYTAHSDKWVMPNEHYTMRVGPVAFFGLDTNGILYDQTGSDQQKWLDAEVAKSDAPWKIVFGHHPYISNGDHGNAGNYDGLGLLPQNPLSPNGETVAAFVESSVCGKAQVYFAGHDHNREWVGEKCGTTFIVSGAAAKLRTMANRDKEPSRFKDDQKHGFLWAEVDGNTLTGVFYDEDGNIDYMDTVTK